MKKTVLYLRSSKDRSDVSIDAQRRELTELAKERGLLIVNEYSDVVESAKSEYRPAFQQLIADLRLPEKTWQAILMIDHSRLSRQPYVGHVFRYECAKHGVEVIFGAFPELDPISKIILDNVMDAMAVVHSVMSKQKGLAGMAENVRRGWRAGGQAPAGYRLAKVGTGAIRDGAPVLKSVLEPSDEAPVIARYLKARAAGVPRAQIVRDTGLTLSPSTLIGIEWNALTYAGHTVWNRHNETKAEGGYIGSQKRRPRSEWHVTRDTHPLLISDAEAEAVLSHLENSEHGLATSKAKRGLSPYLLSYVLQAPDGRKWEGWRDRYRVKSGEGKAGRYVIQDRLDKAVVSQIVADFQSDKFVDALVEEARKTATSNGDEDTKTLRHEVTSLNDSISKAMDLALKLDDPAPALKKVNELELRRKNLSAELVRLEREHKSQQGLRGITHEHVRSLVMGMAEEIGEAELPRLKSLIQATIEKITLEPISLDCVIHYRIPVERTLSMASPRGFEPLSPP